MNANKIQSSRSLDSFTQNANVTERNRGNRASSIKHLISIALLAGLALILAACGAASASQEWTNKQLPPTPVAPTAAPTVAPTPTAKFISAAGPKPSTVPASAGAYKSYKSDKYAYMIRYPADWKIQVQTAGPSAPGEDRENVFLTSPGGGLPQVQILALKGAPPITGFENCAKNLQFRGIPACSISLAGGQQPATQMLLFQKGDAYLHLAIQYETPAQLGVFDEIVRSFQFTSSAVPATTTPASWQSYRSDQGGFRIQYPSDWKFSELPPQNAGLLKSARIEGTEGGIELLWGTGLGGMCEENGVSKYIRVPAVQGGLQTCYSKDRKGLEQWNQISTPGLKPGFQARAWTKDARVVSREIVLKVIASLYFDQP